MSKPEIPLAVPHYLPTLTAACFYPDFFYQHPKYSMSKLPVPPGSTSLFDIYLNDVILPQSKTWNLNHLDFSSQSPSTTPHQLHPLGQLSDLLHSNLFPKLNCCLCSSTLQEKPEVPPTTWKASGAPGIVFNKSGLQHMKVVISVTLYTLVGWGWVEWQSTCWAQGPVFNFQLRKDDNAQESSTEYSRNIPGLSGFSMTRLCRHLCREWLSFPVPLIDMFLCALTQAVFWPQMSLRPSSSGRMSLHYLVWIHLPMKIFLGLFHSNPYSLSPLSLARIFYYIIHPHSVLWLVMQQSTPSRWKNAASLPPSWCLT